MIEKLLEEALQKKIDEVTSFLTKENKDLKEKLESRVYIIRVTNYGAGLDSMTMDEYRSEDEVTKELAEAKAEIEKLRNTKVYYKEHTRSTIRLNQTSYEETPIDDLTKELFQHRKTIQTYNRLTMWERVKIALSGFDLPKDIK